MALHNDLGKEGERLAENYLVQQGFTILHRNWRYDHLEVDLIALKGHLLHFIEVKTRSSAYFGRPELNVTRGKIKCLIRAANLFLIKHPHYRDFRIDVLSITALKNTEPEFFFIQDVYL